MEMGGPTGGISLDSIKQEASKSQPNTLTAKVQPGTKAAKSWATKLVKVFEFQIDLSKI